MKVSEIELRSTEETEFIDITDRVQDIVEKEGVADGSVYIFSPHTTGAIIINEKESGLISDYALFLDKIVPRGSGYSHDKIDNNAHSHLRALILGPGKKLVVYRGKLALGTWQRIFFVELDGPRVRRVIIEVN